MSAVLGLRERARPLLRAVRRSRGLLAAACAAGAVATALPHLAPEPPPGTAVLVAARDLPAGAALAAEDVEVLRLPADLAPDGALPVEHPVDGRHLAGALRRGEALTDARLVGPGLLAAAPDGLVAAPVRLADPASAALLRPGDRVDVLAAAPDGSAAPTAARDAAVLAVPAGRSDLDGALVVLAVDRATAARLAAAAVAARLSVLVRP